MQVIFLKKYEKDTYCDKPLLAWLKKMDLIPSSNYSGDFIGYNEQKNLMIMTTSITAGITANIDHSLFANIPK